MNRKKNTGHFAEDKVLIDRANNLDKPVLKMSLYIMCLEVQMGKQIFFFLYNFIKCLGRVLFYATFSA